MSKFNDEVVSKEMLETLTRDLNFNIPDIDLDSISLDDLDIEVPTELLDALKQSPTQINIDTLTKPEIGGDATFDRLMYAVKIHLKEEVDKGRITGSEYASAYVTMAGNAMQSAVQYELNRYQTNYQAILSHINAITAIVEAKCKLASSKVQLATAKVMYASSVAQANNHRATYADTVMNLGIKDANYGLVNAQKDSVDASVIRDDSVSAQQIRLMGSQKDSIDAAVIREDAVSAQQIKLMVSQKDSIDASVIRENNLTDQQIKSYIIKDKRECAKIYSDSYITNLSVDAGMKVPDSMTDTNISAVMDSLRQASGL